MKSFYNKYKGKLVKWNGATGVVVGYRNPTHLIAAFIKDEGCLSYDDMLAFDFIEKDFANNQYSFTIISPSIIYGKDSDGSQLVMMKTLEELQNDPKNKFEFTQEHCVRVIKRTGSAFHINEDMMKYCGKLVDLNSGGFNTKVTPIGEDASTNYKFCPWMYNLMK
jgi:hypothetical protein